MPSILDAFPYPWFKQEAQQLLVMLSQRYPTAQAAALAAQRSGIDITTINAQQAVTYVWKEILDAAAQLGLIRTLVRDVHNQLPEGSPMWPFLGDLLADRPTPTFVSATGDPHDAILLGECAFIDRKELRREVRYFTEASDFTSRVLVVRGEKISGKSHTWFFLLHLARKHNVQPILLELRQSPSITPRDLFRRVGKALNLSTSDLPAMPDDPQESRTLYQLLDWFEEKVKHLRQRCWLVIDDLNQDTTTLPMQDAAYAIARSVEKNKPEYLWVALLGYNEPITDHESRSFRLDEASFPDASSVSIDFECIASSGKNSSRVPHVDSRHLADLLFLLQDDPLDKDAKLRLASAIETMAGILLLGFTDPDVQFVARYFEDVVRATGNRLNRLSSDEALQCATLIFEKFRNENAQDLPRLAGWIKEMRDKLKAGQRL